MSSLPSAWDDGRPRFKERGRAVLERVERRKLTKAAEEAEKRKVRLRDRGCRWPGCTHQKDGIRLEVAHVVSKAAGGDHGIRSTVEQMILICYLHHQGPESLHSKDLQIEPLTARGTDGPVSFWRRDEKGDFYLWKAELQPGGPYEKD